MARHLLFLRRLLPLVVGSTLFVNCTRTPDSVDTLRADSAFTDIAGWAITGPTQLINMPDTATESPLFRVSNAIRLGNGEVILANLSSNEILRFNSAGTLAAVLGGTGGGPSKFGSLQGIWLSGDTIVAWDLLAQRLVYWSVDGQVGRETHLQLDYLPSAIRRYADGRLLSVRSASRVARHPAGTVSIDSVTADLVSATGQVLSSLGRFPYRRMYYMDRPGGSVGRTGFPLLPKGEFAVGGTVTYFGFGDKWQIIKYAQNGIVLDTIPLERRRQPLSAELREEWIQGMLTLASPSRVLTRGFLESLPFPDSLPAFDALLVDTEDNLWVRAFAMSDEDMGHWSVLSSNGQWLGEVAFPPRFSPTHISADHVTGVLRDSDDRELIAIFAIQRNGGAT